MKIDFRTKVATEAVAQGKLEPQRARQLEKVVAKGLELAAERGMLLHANGSNVMLHSEPYRKLGALERVLVRKMYNETLKSLAASFTGAAAKRIEYIADGVPKRVVGRYDAVAAQLDAAVPSIPGLAGKVASIGTNSFSTSRAWNDLPALQVNLTSTVSDAERDEVRSRVATWLKSNRYNSIIAGRPLEDAIWVRNPIKEI